MKNSLARTALLAASLGLVAVTARAQARFQLTINGKTITDDSTGTNAPTAKPSARLILPTAPIKPGQPFDGSLEIKNPGNGKQTKPDETPVIRWENGTALEVSPAASMTHIGGGMITRTVRFGLNADAPGKPGTYKIPASTITLGGAEVQVPEGVITVRELAPGEPPYEKMGYTIEVPEVGCFPGQIIPMKLIITETDDERLMGLNNLRLSDDNALTISPSSGKIEAREVTLNGKTRRRIEIPLLARSLVADDFSAVVTIDLRLDFSDGNQGMRRAKIPLRIRSMHAPETGKPASYRGAIGRFAVSPPELSAQKGKAGEPLRLAYAVTGEGALDRVVGPELTSPDWSSRMEKPVYERKPDGSVDKTFAYSLTPLYGGEIRVPAAEFSWFDPTDMKYHTAAIGGQTITVEGPARPVEKISAGPKTPVLAEDPAPAGVTRTHGALFASRTFLGAQLAAFVALIAACALVARRRRIAADPVLVKRIRDLRLMRRHRRAARHALSAGVHAGYATCAREALRAAAALDTTAEPEALTGAETLAALPADDASRATLATLFAHEEARLYAGSTGADESVKDTAAALFATLAKAESRQR